MKEYTLNVKQSVNHLVTINADSEEDAIKRLASQLDNGELGLVATNEIHEIEKLRFGYVPVDIVDTSVARICAKSFQREPKYYRIEGIDNKPIDGSDNKLAIITIHGYNMVKNIYNKVGDNNKQTLWARLGIVPCSQRPFYKPAIVVTVEYYYTDDKKLKACMNTLKVADGENFMLVKERDNSDDFYANRVAMLSEATSTTAIYLLDTLKESLTSAELYKLICEGCEQADLPF